MRLRTIGKFVVIGTILVVAAASSSGCTSVSTQPDQVALHYQAGPLSATSYSDCVKPSTRNWNGPGDKSYWYPNGQRIFEFAGGPDSETKPFTVVSKDNQELQVSGLLTFNLDTTCVTEGKDDGGILRKFHENIGLKYQAYMTQNADGWTTSQGWKNMLLEYMGQSLQKMTTTAAQKYDWLALYNDPQTRVNFEKEINDQLPEVIKATTGGVDYFKGFNLTLQKPEPNKQLIDAMTAVQVAVTQKKAIDQQNANINLAMRGLRDLTSTLGPYGAILYQTLQACMAGKMTAGCPTFLPVAPGTNVNIPATK